MKKKLIICLLAAVLLAGCLNSKASTSTSTNTSTGEGAARSLQDFADITAKEWKLMEVYIDGVNTNFNRDSQPESFSRDIFSLKMEDGTISGMGAPNRYSGRYTLNENQGISITPLASTMMASLFEPENLREFEYFSYIQSTHSWSIINNGSNLELLSVTNDGKPVRMVFAL